MKSAFSVAKPNLFPANTSSNTNPDATPEKGIKQDSSTLNRPTPSAFAAHANNASTASLLSTRAARGLERVSRTPASHSAPLSLLPQPLTHIGIVEEKEGERRVPLTPEQCAVFKKSYPDVQLSIQASQHRIYKNDAYAAVGVQVVQSLEACQVLLGIKEVPIDKILKRKVYAFFSHTYKGQNPDLLRAYAAARITLIDWERILAQGKRLVGFGYYAGLAGAYNGLRGWLQRKHPVALAAPETQADLAGLTDELKKFEAIQNCRIVVTGVGHASDGAQKILQLAGFKEISPEDFLRDSTHSSDQPGSGKIYTVLSPQHYVTRTDGAAFSKTDFYAHPDQYRSAFLPYARCANLYFACHYQARNAPAFFTREQAQADDFRVEYIADISCDIAGPIPSTFRASSIKQPFYGWNPELDLECDPNDVNGIGVMAVDNLPTALSEMASEGFGYQVLAHVLPLLIEGDAEGVLRRATELHQGELTPPYLYLRDSLELQATAG